MKYALISSAILRGRVLGPGIRKQNEKRIFSPPFSISRK